MISDPLHIFKNGRSKILRDNTVVNLDNFGDGVINSIEIEKILKIGDALADKSSLGKMRDCYPLNLFTINNTIQLFYNSNKETFFYFLFYSLWNEVLLNFKISVKIRIYFFEILLRICIQIFSIIKARNPRRYVGYRKCEQKPFVFFFYHRIKLIE